MIYVPRDSEADEWRVPDTEPAPPPCLCGGPTCDCGCARPDEAILVWVDPLADEEALP